LLAGDRARRPGGRHAGSRSRSARSRSSPAHAAELIVPAVIVGKDAAGRAWVTTIDDASRRRSAARRRGAVATATYRIGALVPTEHYLARSPPPATPCATATLTKAVIARPVLVEADRPIDVRAVLHRLKASFGRATGIRSTASSAPRPSCSWRSTARRSAPTRSRAPRRAPATPTATPSSPPQLVASTKDQVEHRVVIEMVHDTLLPWVSYLDWQPEPSIVTVANVQHLGSAGRDACRSPAPSVIELVRALCPTPALGGHPRDAALELIAEGRGLRARPLRRCGRVGRRPRQRHVGGDDPVCGARPPTGARPGWWRAAASSPTATRPPSSPRPRPSCRRCSADLLVDLARHGALAGHGGGMVVRVDHHGARLLLALVRRLLGVVVVALDHGDGSAEPLDVGALDRRRGRRHEHLGRHAEL
jgi:hypothetical protein